MGAHASMLMTICGALLLAACSGIVEHELIDMSIERLYDGPPRETKYVARLELSTRSGPAAGTTLELVSVDGRVAKKGSTLVEVEPGAHRIQVVCAVDGVPKSFDYAPPTVMLEGWFYKLRSGKGTDGTCFFVWIQHSKIADARR